ncbi:histone-lysine N-methyltransferase SETMAR [Trichonephila clavipes]|nr:histone-lysine N-methyltransferase SETMAR [Trichonephila clavipes]
MTLLDQLNEKIKKKHSQMQKKKVLFFPDNVPCHVHENDSQVERIVPRITFPPDVQPRPSPSDYWLFADIKRIFQAKRFGSNKEIITNVGVYFESKDKPFYEKGIKKLEEHWTECTTREGKYLDK